MKTIIKKYHRIWEWQIILDGKVIAGGYGRTKKDATNDADVWKTRNVEVRHAAPDARNATDGQCGVA